MAIGRSRNAFAIDWFARFARDLRDCNESFHRADVSELRRAEDDISYGVNAGFVGLLPGIHFDKFTFGLDLRFFQADVLRARLASHGDQNLFRVDFVLLAIDCNGDRNTRFRLFYFVDLRTGVEVDAALAIDAREFFADFFVFHRDEPWEHLYDCYFAIEGAVDRGKFNPDCSGADNHQRFRDFFQAENFDVRQDAIVRFHAGQHAGFRTTGEDDVLRFELRRLGVVCDFDGEDSVLCGAGQLAVALDGLDFVLLHEEVEALGVFRDDLVLAVLDGGPVELP